MRIALNHPKLGTYICDLSNEAKLRQAMKAVNYVFHAAELIHVPSCEFYPTETLRTNVIGTENVLNAATDIYTLDDYKSQNTKRLNVVEVKSLLLNLDYIKDELHA
jgi:nucleoside-diphosphate-sugar epimerase